jgi:hypothetical protein
MEFIVVFSKRKLPTGVLEGAGRFYVSRVARIKFSVIGDSTGKTFPTTVLDLVQ